ncbi:MAG: hypothetical protein ACRCTZ_16125 [Sarcina sp.]
MDNKNYAILYKQQGTMFLYLDNITLDVAEDCRFIAEYMLGLEGAFIAKNHGGGKYEKVQTV